MGNNTEYKSDTLNDIINSEHQMVIDGEKLYGSFYKNALDFYQLLQDFITQVSAEKLIFCIFFNQIRKHSLLAILSTLRRQDTQAMMNLRQVLEAGALASYSIAKGDWDDLIAEDNEDMFKKSEKYKDDAYKWLEENYKKGSDAIQTMKRLINKSSAHNNVIMAHRSFNFNSKEKVAETPFFDIEDDYLTKTALWQAANIIMGIMDLTYGVSQKYKGLEFTEDFTKRLKTLESTNNKLKAEMMANKRYKNASKQSLLKSLVQQSFSTTRQSHSIIGCVTNCYQNVL